MLKRQEPVLTIILSIVTCGIYGLYTYYCMIRDMKVMYPDKIKDDDIFSNFILLIVLAYVTGGIFTYIWMFKFGGNMKLLGNEDGVDIKEDGTFYILFSLLGIVTCGICSIISMYKYFSNFNLLVDNYNTKNGFTA